MRDHLLIVGASARAAAYSALRAGLHPWCMDLFADADLQARCPVTRMQGRYPDGFAEAILNDTRGPWMYTGGLENYPRFVARMSKRRPLWGNDGNALKHARDPARLSEVARESGLPSPLLEMRPADGRWLVKPRSGAGGIGIRFRDASEGATPAKCYLQEHIDGPSASVVFVGTALLGVTRQLVGEVWLRAPAFRYCGSVGPLAVSASLRQRLESFAELAVSRLGLRGLYGVDGILRDGDFWPVELNPRYPASVEVLEHATGLQAMTLHAAEFGWRAVPVKGRVRSRHEPAPLQGRLAAKAILYARADLMFPAMGPWTDTIDDFADLPHPQDTVEAGKPILTLFAAGDDEAACLSALRRRAAEVEACLYAGE